MSTRSSSRTSPRWMLAALLVMSVAGCEPGLLGVDSDYAGSEGGHHPPAAPSDLMITLLGPTSVSLSWQDHADDEEGFRVYRGAAGGPAELVASVGQDVTTAADSGLAPGTPYDFSVVAFNADGESTPATASIIMPEDTLPPGTQLCVIQNPAKRVLVDASKDGGVWWFPQGSTFDPAAPHQGKALADYLRCRGYVVTELGRDGRMTDSLARANDVIIRANRFGPAYTNAEIEAYRQFLERSTTLVLLSDHQTHTDGRDELADLVGIGFEGVSADEEVTRFADHPITRGVTALRYLVGAHVVARDTSAVQFLGRLADGKPVMGVASSGKAKVFFLGDTNALEALPQPVLDNLVGWGF